MARLQPKNKKRSVDNDVGFHGLSASKEADKLTMGFSLENIPGGRKDPNDAMLPRRKNENEIPPKSGFPRRTKAFEITYPDDFVGGAIHHLEELENEPRGYIVTSGSYLSGRGFLLVACFDGGHVTCHCLTLYLLVLCCGMDNASHPLIFKFGGGAFI